MPKQFDWDLIGQFRTKKTYEKFKSNNHEFKIVHSKTVQKCEICLEKHKMMIQRGKCNNINCYDESACPVQIKVHTCQKDTNPDKQKRLVYQIDTHNSETTAQTARHGISDGVKKVINELIETYDDRPDSVSSYISVLD
jgi:hypothetical protein